MRDVVWFQIDELNGLYDTLQPSRGGEIPERRLATARPRVSRILLAAAWNPDDYCEHAWSFVNEGIERPEDAFGPAAILLGVPDRRAPEAQRWLDGIPAPVARTLRSLGLLTAA
jgi:hypothetical protein